MMVDSFHDFVFVDSLFYGENECFSGALSILMIGIKSGRLRRDHRLCPVGLHIKNRL